MDSALTGPADASVNKAEAMLAGLGLDGDAMKVLLMRLLQDALDADPGAEDSHAHRLLQANEQLVLAALRNQTEADAARQAVTDAAREIMVDPLTGLCTRRALQQRFSQVVAQVRRNGRRCALVFIDLDGFKALNDSRGHAFGDRVLHQVAQRMVAAVREVDTVSRHGGDEFVVLLGDLAQTADAQAVADKILQAVAQPMDVGGTSVDVSASAGIAAYPDDGEEFDALIERADALMYADKRARADLAAASSESQGSEPAERVPATEADAPTPEPPGRLADLREANERLLLAVLSTQELQRAAEQAMERQQIFMREVAAELGNPLAPVRIASAMLGQSADDKRLLERVERAIQSRMKRMADAIDTLLRRLGSDAGALVLQRQTLDLGAAVSEAVEAKRSICERRGLRLCWQRPAPSFEIDADPLRVQQILANLIENACAHTPDGGSVELSLAADASSVFLTVADDGTGVSSAELPTVFDPFQQAFQALDVDVSSLDLGLAATRALVRAHGGEIAAYSEGLHRGSRFVVTLPRFR